MDSDNTEMKERLRLAAARCIVNSDHEWWSHLMTDAGEFAAANDWNLDEETDTFSELETPGDAANFLLLVAEAIDE